MMHHGRRALLLAFVLSASACSGGSTGTAPRVVAASPAPAARGMLSLTVAFPPNLMTARRPGSAARSPQYLNPNPGNTLDVNVNGSPATPVSVAPVNGLQTIQVPVTLFNPPGPENVTVDVTEVDGGGNTLAAATGQVISYQAGTDNTGTVLLLQMNAVGMGISTSPTAAATTINVQPGGPPAPGPTFHVGCSPNTTFFLYALDPSNNYVTSFYGGVPPVGIYFQSTAGTSMVAQNPSGAYTLVTDGSNFVTLRVLMYNYVANAFEYGTVNVDC